VPRLSAVPGVGRKTAERIVLELREKLAKGQPELGNSTRPRGHAHEVVADAVTALQNLGYPRVVAERAVRQVLRATDAGQTPELKELLRDALRCIGQEKGE
jgi:Holliday junction DNA helicase RuvA